MADDGYIKIKTKIEGLAESLKGIKDLGIGLFGVGTIYKTVTGAVKQLYAALDDLNKAYKAQKTAEVQLEAAAKNNPYLDSSSVKKLQKYASGLQAISTIGDEQLLPFMAQLAASGRTEAQIMQIMSAALNASASGMISLDEAVRGLNNSYTGNIGRLGMQIPALKSLTDEELRAGKAVDVVASTYKGLAEKTSGATGSSEKLKNAISDVKEELGSAVERGLRPWNEKLTELATKTADALRETRKLKEALDALNGGTAGVADYERLLAENQVRVDEYNKAIQEINDGYEKGLIPAERYFSLLATYNKEYGQYLTNQEIWTIALENAKAAEKAANSQAEADKKEAEAAKQAAAAENKRSEYLAKNAEAREKAVNALKAEADLRGEQVDDEALLDVYVKSYISLLGDAPGLVRADDKEARALLETLQAQVKTVRERQAASRDAATMAELQLAETERLETRLARFRNRLGSITGPDGRTAEEKLDDEIKALRREYEEILDIVGDNDDLLYELQEEFGRKMEVLAKQQHDAKVAKEKEWAARDAETMLELQKFDQAAAEAALGRFKAQLDGISSPDGRTAQEKIADERRQLEQFYNEIMDMTTVSEEEKLEIEEQYTQARIALIQKEKEAELAAADEVKKARRDMAIDALNSLASTVNTMAALAKENSQANLDVKIAEIEAEELSEEEKNKKILEAQKKAAKEQYRIELWQWTVSSLQAAANIAEGISKCFAQSGPYGFITSALVAAAGAAQIAAISLSALLCSNSNSHKAEHSPSFV